MIVNATDLKNNLGKYLRLSAREEIIVTSNDRYVARLTAHEDASAARAASGIVREEAEALKTIVQNRAFFSLPKAKP